MTTRSDPVRIIDSNGNVIGSNNPLPVDGTISVVTGSISTDNQSTTPLGSGETFTGTAEQNLFAQVGVSCHTDQPGTLFFDFSNDGANYNTFPVNGFDVAANIHEFHTAVKLGRYFRVRLVNDNDGAQTFLRLYTYYGNNFFPSSTPLNQSIGKDSDALITRPAASFLTEIAQGKVGGHDFVAKFGRNSEINIASTPEDVWEGGGTYTGQPTGSPETVEVFSSDAADDSAGTGMRTLRIFGLLTSDATEETSEDVVLDGVTPVNTVNTWYRIYRALGLTYGSGGTNAGIITIRHNVTTANVFASIPAGRGQTAIAAWTCPAGKTAYLVGFYVSMARGSGAAGSAEISFRVREFGSGGYNAKKVYETTNSTPANPPLTFPEQIPAQADVKITVDSVSDNSTIVTGDLDILIVTN